jgi:hypothetical protein
MSEMSSIPDWSGTFEHGYLVRRKRFSHGWPEAWFRYAADAERFVATSEYSDNLEVVDQDSDRRVVGTTGHGHAILETLRKKGAL